MNLEQQQIYYWAHMLDESMFDKCLLTEDEEGKNINRAEKWIRDNHPEIIGSMIEGFNINSVRDAISMIREKIPSSRLPLAKGADGKPIIKVRHNGQEIQKGTCRWMLGVCRIFFSEILSDEETLSQNVSFLNDVLKVISDRHEEDFRDNNLNGLTFKQLENSFKNEVDQLKADERNRVQTSARDLVKNDHYTIVTIDSFEEAEQFYDYAGWCVTESEEAFDSYTQEGIRRFYFCIRDDYKTVQKERGPNYPKDSYGSSMLAILIDDDGSMNSTDGCTCRWNNGNDRVYEPEEIQKLLGVDFYKTFVPYTGQELMKKYQKLRIEDDEMSRVLGGIKIEQDLTYFYVVADGNKIRKYKLVADNCIVYHGKFYHAENGQIKNGTLQKVDGDFDCSWCETLSSLSGGPQEIRGDFYCSHCDNLTSLSGAPQKVGGDFSCSQCDGLTSLFGVPQKVKSFSCYSCKNLSSLSGAPQKVGRDFYCCACDNLTSLSGAPQKVGGYFSCSGCKNLTSLSGAPQKVGGFFSCNACENLTSLAGAPIKIGEFFEGKGTKIPQAQIDAYLAFLRNPTLDHIDETGHYRP